MGRKLRQSGWFYASCNRYCAIGSEGPTRSVCSPAVDVSEHWCRKIVSRKVRYPAEVLRVLSGSTGIFNPAPIAWAKPLTRYLLSRLRCSARLGVIFRVPDVNVLQRRRRPRQARGSCHRRHTRSALLPRDVDMPCDAALFMHVAHLRQTHHHHVATLGNETLAVFSGPARANSSDVT